MAAILVYHSQFAWARGGFLGVSQFFTLSGFLVGGLLLSEHRRSGTIDLRRFWTRRFRRLAPASVLALLGSVLFGVFVAEPSQVNELPRQVFAASLYLANWEFVSADLSYAAMFEAPSPVQHFWSLSLEEQFYFFMPLLIIGLMTRLRSWWSLAAVLAALSAGSLMWSRHLLGGGDNVDRVYYGTDTRLAEILLGVLLAIVVLRRSMTSRLIRTVVGWVGAGAGLASLWLFHVVSVDDQVLWQGGIAGFSLLTVLVLAGIMANEGPLRLLSWRPLAVIGRVSYGLYLFHWPIFLWLTEQRTGLDPWPLFALRVSVTAVVAAASYHFVEMPIRRGASLGLPALARVGAVPVLSLALVASALVVAETRGGAEERTFGEEELTAPPVVPGDPVLNLLIVADSYGAATAAEMERRADSDPALEVTVAETFGCGEIVDSEWGRICSRWLNEWPDLIETHDPDATLLYVDRWPSGDQGVFDPTKPTHELLGEIMSSGLDVLTERGAPVAWVSTPPSFQEGIRRTNDPFHITMREFRLVKSDLRMISGLPTAEDTSDPVFAEEAADVLLRGLATHRRRAAEARGKVMIIGDSQAQSVGFGLERWSAVNGGPAVWNAGVGGCGLVVGGEIISLSSGQPAPVDPVCVEAIDNWHEGVESFDPDRVLVLTSFRDLQPRRLDGWADFAFIGDPRLDAHVLESYVAAVDSFSSAGAEVVWMIPPCPGSTSGGYRGEGSPFDPEPLNQLHDQVLPALGDEHPGLSFFDLDEVLCPGGSPLAEVEGAGVVRPDGLHLTATSSPWLAEIIGPELLDLDL